MIFCHLNSHHALNTPTHQSLSSTHFYHLKNSTMLASNSILLQTITLLILDHHCILMLSQHCVARSLLFCLTQLSLSFSAFTLVNHFFNFLCIFLDHYYHLSTSILLNYYLSSLIFYFIDLIKLSLNQA